jgi:hypothetical protein
MSDRLHVCLSVCMFVHPSFLPSFRPAPSNQLAPTRQIFMQLVIFRKSAEKIQVSLQSDNNNRRFTWRDQNTYSTTSRSILFKIGNVTDKFVETTGTHLTFYKSLFETLAVYEITRKNTIQPGRSQMTIWHMSIAYWKPMATNKHSVYVILIAFSTGKKWLHERASMLCYT